jgi:hypothetical protein
MNFRIANFSLMGPLCRKFARALCKLERDALNISFSMPLVF